MKIVTIIGARPQFIKAAAVSREIAKHQGIEEIIVHTGQHFDKNMSDIFFEQMSIPKPDYQLNINSLSHGAMTGQMLEKIEEVILKEKPSWVMVYGDTNSTIAGALAAKKQHYKVTHVEAGLRSFNMKMPEEINRILTDRISDMLFCPTDQAIRNLQNEGFDNFPCTIVKNGDVMQDAALFYSEKAEKPAFEIPSEFVLATVHRAENTDEADNLKNIFEALETIAEKQPVIIPLHPRTRKILENNRMGLDNKNILVTDPVGYLQVVYLLKNCKLLITDSGGMQKEAYFFGKPCVTIREQTEWIELVENGYNMIAGTRKDNIISCYETMLSSKPDYSKELYGGGKASEIIIRELLKK